jgi:hypothetical protein
VANDESGLAELAARLADALGAAQIPPGAPTTSLVDLVEQQESGDKGLTPAQVAQILAGGGAAGGAGEGTATAVDPAATLTATVEQLRSVEQVQADAVGQNTEAIKSSASSQSSSGGGSALDTIGSAAANALESGLELAPLISGLVSLFGGSDGATTPPALSTYTAPESVQFEGDVYRSGNVTDWGGSGGTQSGAPLPTNQQITVQVNALDSQSFLDHSQDIANAVRQAMLNSNSLNDVVNDL